MACIPVLSVADAVWVQCVKFSFQLVVHKRHRWAVLTKVKLCRVSLRIMILCVADLVEQSVVVCDCIVQAVESWRELDQIGRVFFDDNLKHLDSWKPKAIANNVLKSSHDMLDNQKFGLSGLFGLFGLFGLVGLFGLSGLFGLLVNVRFTSLVT